MNRSFILAPFVLAVSAVVPSVSAQPAVRSFDGDHGPGLALCQTGVTHCDRAEMDVAVSGKQVVQVTWQNVSVYDHGGRLLRATPLAEFIRAAGLDPNPPKAKGPFEPHVVFDEFIDRWVLTATCLNDCVLVSSSADALKSWGGTYLSCGQGGPCLDFDPAIHVGYDRNGVYACAGHVGDDNPHTVPGVALDCFAIPSAEVPPIARGVAPVHLNRAHNMALDLVPAVDHDRSKAPSAPAFFAAKTCDRAQKGGCQNSRNFAFEWLVSTFTWKGTGGTYDGGGGPQVIKTAVGSTENKWLYNSPCCGTAMAIPQAGSDVALRAATSHRLMNVVQSGSHLHGAHGSGPCTEGCGAQGTDTGNVLFAVDLDCSKPSACVVAHTTKIAGPFHAEFGTVGVDKAGNIGIVGTSSTAGTNLSVLLWTHAASDPTYTFDGPVVVASGTQPYTCLGTGKMVPMGNSAGTLTALDPSDGTSLWATQQWANDARPCVWNTRIVRYRVAPSAAKSARPGARK